MHEINWFPAIRPAGVNPTADDALRPLSCITGWGHHSRRLTNRIASLNRATAENATIIGVAAMLDGVYCAIAYVQAGSPATAAHLAKALEAFRSRCLTTCEICGKPARALVVGGVRCPGHEHPSFHYEAVFDPRQIARYRRSWMACVDAKFTGRLMKHGQWPAIPVYDHAGACYVRANDAPPGQRQMFFEALVDDGFKPEMLGNSWVFRISGAQHD